MNILLKLLAGIAFVILAIVYGVLKVAVLIAGPVLGILSVIVAIAGIAILFLVSPLGGAVWLAIAFAISPFGIPRLAAVLVGKLGGLGCILKDYIAG